MKFSIITVVYNDLENLKVTYNSIRNQTFTDYEYIVVDGKSTDGTANYLEDIKSSDSHVRYISEKDNGIYDAMNKGVGLSAGDYVLFLGAADTFYTDTILQEVNEFLDGSVDVFYGKVVFSSGENKGKTLGDKLNFFSILLDRYVAHQSVFAKREIALEFPFDLSYRFLADQDFMMNARDARKRLKYVNKIICYYDGNGFSSSLHNREELVKERIRLIHHHSTTAFFIRNSVHVLKGQGKYTI
ncbi:MAG: glycosyltransferase [Lachnospiraceae bacterium]|nr:glycosyltransferase [Lachnospiraceae bacterium]